MCTGCGIASLAVLSIDHKAGSGAKKRKQDEINSVTLYNKILRMAAPCRWYQVLCFNCQRFKRTMPQKEFLSRKDEIVWGPKLPGGFSPVTRPESELAPEEDWLDSMSQGGE